MRVMRAVLALVLLGGGAFTAGADPGSLAPEDLQRLLSTYNAPPTAPRPFVIRSEGGFVNYLGAPSGTHFDTEVSIQKSSFSAGEVALQFVDGQRAAFGVENARVDFELDNVAQRGAAFYVRLRQTYDGLPVFAGVMTLQIDTSGGIAAIIADVMRDTERLDAGGVSLSPTLTQQEGADAAVSALANLLDRDVDDLVASSPELLIYRPALLGVAGATRLVWSVVVSSTDVSAPLEERLFSDAHTGDVVFRYSLIHTAKERRVYDAQNAFVIRENLIRSEGDPPVGDPPEADLAYDFLGNTWDFYSVVHGRDGIDGLGSPMHATVRFGLNFENAFWTGADMVFGEGFLTDDVTGHELTHGVTESTSNLIYFAESGAINESFSDSLGEFIDLTNGAGNDSAAVRWIMGEEVLVTGEDGEKELFPIRNMADPPSFSWNPPDRTRTLVDPDRLNHPDFYRGLFDNSGVHHNSGVGNKLAYLLTDGDTFNGFTVRGMGINTTAQLFYETQFLLPRAASYFDLFAALLQGTINLGMSAEDQRNVVVACQAVEIATFGIDVSSELENVRALPAAGSQNFILVMWREPELPTLRVNRVVQQTGAFPVSEDDGEVLFVRGLDESNLIVSNVVLAGPFTSNEERFYAVFWASGSRSGVKYSRAVPGAAPPDFLVEAFTGAAGKPIDLEFSQILFSPILDPLAAQASGQPQDYGDFTNYAATIERNVFELPVPREDPQGGGTSLVISDDGFFQAFFSDHIFPFFGRFRTNFAVAGNGYIDFGPNPCEFCLDNFPFLFSHGDNVRISFLSGNLSPVAGGSVWGRELDDRLVITFEDIPERAVSFPFPAATNTVQVEMFFSGHIRITYLELAAELVNIGISDGNGIVSDPGISGAPLGLRPTDFSTLPEGNPDALTIWPPIPIQTAEEGERVQFIASTNIFNRVPTRADGIVFDVTWDRPGELPDFTDFGDGRVEFTWTPDSRSAGLTVVTIRAIQQQQVAAQVVPIFVSDVALRPFACSLEIAGLRGSSEIVVGEGSSITASLDTDLALEARYVYLHPEIDSDGDCEIDAPGLTLLPSLQEGISTIQWYRNLALVPIATNRKVISPDLTEFGEVWFYTIKPRTADGLAGGVFVSPRVRIVNNPDIDGDSIIAPQFGAAIGSTSGGTRVRITGRKLSQPTSVTFGGREGSGLSSLGDEELEVIAPAAPAGAVDVIVTTAKGRTVVPGGFLFQSNLKGDVNRDGRVDALDVQLVVEAVLDQSKARMSADVDSDGELTSQDVQVVVNSALKRE